MAVVESRIITYGVREVREIKADASEVALIRPMLGGTTQADANENFHTRLEELEKEIDGGSY